MAEIVDRRNTGIDRDEISGFVIAHSGDPVAIRAAIVAAHPNSDVDFVVVEGGSQILLADYILQDLASYS